MTKLRQKWKPILKKRTISQEELEQYNKDVEKFIEENPDWKENIVYI